MSSYKIAVIGASGKMGQAIIKGLSKVPDLKIVAAIDRQNVGQDAGELAGIPPLGVLITDQLEEVLVTQKPEIVIDFTQKKAAQENIPRVLEQGIAVVAGTTGFGETDLAEFDRLARENETAMFLAPNFSLGAVLMMRFAREASRFYQQAEIIEYHNVHKVDSPSGTAISTAKKMVHAEEVQQPDQGTASCRGGDFNGVKIHSVRLPCMVAHQEVLLAGQGELLTIRHDSFSRESFLPGILLAIRQVRSWQGLRVGLEEILEWNN